LLFLPGALWAQKPEAGDAQKRVELNLLGKEDAAKGESRRNENIQFNLVDNNALKELNVRLGATATLVEEFRADRGYFGAEFGTPAPGPIALAAQRRAGWHGNLFANHQNSVFSARAFFQVGDVKPARENRYGFQTGGSPWRGGFVSLQGSQEKLRGQVNGNVLVPYADERTALATDPAVRALVQHYLDAFGPELPNRANGTRQLNTNAPQRIDSNDGAIALRPLPVHEPDRRRLSVDRRPEPGYDHALPPRPPHLESRRQAARDLELRPHRLAARTGAERRGPDDLDGRADHAGAARRHPDRPGAEYLPAGGAIRRDLRAAHDQRRRRAYAPAVQRPGDGLAPRLPVVLERLRPDGD